MVLEPQSSGVDQRASAIAQTQEAFRECPGQAGLFDVAFIGNTSGAYEWEPSDTIDVDIFLFARGLDEALGVWLLDAGDRVRRALGPTGVGFELRVIRGAFKLACLNPAGPVVLAHVGIFTEATYLECPVTLRWAWRKYRCRVEPGRLARLAPDPPGWDDLWRLASRKLRRMEEGAVRMTEWLLPSFTEKVLEFQSPDPMVAEYSFSSANACARAHARILGFEEADRLGNADFAHWYRKTVLNSPALVALMELKDRARADGYAGLTELARPLINDYLRALLRRIGPERGANEGQDVGQLG
jgi:hypothetical protein